MTSSNAGTVEKGASRRRDRSAASPVRGDIDGGLRAGFLLQAPTEANKVKSYAGSVTWSVDSNSAGTDKTARADLEIPDIALKMTMLFRKVDQSQIAGSYAIDIQFVTSGDRYVGNVDQIDIPQMRNESAGGGDPILGVATTIKPNSFVVRLARGNRISRSLDLIRTRNWFDIPLLMSSGKFAKITFEQGGVGHDDIAEVLAQKTIEGDGPGQDVAPGPIVQPPKVPIDALVVSDRRVAVPPPQMTLTFQPLESKDDIEPGFRYSVLKKLKNVFREFDRQAEREHLNGTTKVRIVLDDLGRLSSAKIIDSSGSDDVDRMAVNIIERGAPYILPPVGVKRIFDLNIAIGNE